MLLKYKEFINESANDIKQLEEYLLTNWEDIYDKTKGENPIEITFLNN